MDGWMAWDFTSFSIEIKLYQGDGWVMDDCVQWNHVYDWKDPPQAGLESGTARSAGQRLNSWATGAPLFLEEDSK